MILDVEDKFASEFSFFTPWTCCVTCCFTTPTNTLNKLFPVVIHQLTSLIPTSWHVLVLSLSNNHVTCCVLHQPTCITTIHPSDGNVNYCYDFCAIQKRCQQCTKFLVLPATNLLYNKNRFWSAATNSVLRSVCQHDIQHVRVVNCD
jgi:hypothetical protein